MDCTKIGLSKTGNNRGEKVKNLQSALKKLGLYSRRVDGYFGYYTEQGVIKFQQDYNLTVDGYVGKETCGKLNDVLKAKEQLTSASSSAEASQAATTRITITDTSPDYQKSETYKLTVFPDVVVLPESEVSMDGSTVTKTGGSIETDPTFDCTKINLQFGSKGEDVKKLQTILKARGYYKYSIDGSFGKYTKEGVIKLQKAQGNDPDGWFGEKTCRKLQQTSTTSNESTGTANTKQRNYVFTDFNSIPSISVDLEGLSYEVTVQTLYTEEKYAHIRKLQKTEFIYAFGGDEVYRHIGYINDMKMSLNDGAQIMELNLVGYTVFLNQTIDIPSDVTDTRVNLLNRYIKEAGMKANVNWSNLPNDSYTLRAQKAESTGTGGTSGGWTEMSNNDCVGTAGISGYGFDMAGCKADTKIGNSSHNYAQDTKGMSAKEAIKDLFNRFKYGSYSDNRTCPEGVWKKTGTIRCNCADAARLTKALGEVHGLRVGIHHWHRGDKGHYFNVIEVDGKVYRYDCCFGSSGYSTSTYGGELCNNLTKNGGPWQ